MDIREVYNLSRKPSLNSSVKSKWGMMNFYVDIVVFFCGEYLFCGECFYIFIVWKLYVVVELLVLQIFN